MAKPTFTNRRRPPPSSATSTSAASSSSLPPPPSVPQQSYTSSYSSGYGDTRSVYTGSDALSSSLSAYVPIAPLPIFRGSPDECPVSHLARFARVCRANNAPSPARIFPVTLDGEAALWYELAVEAPGPPRSWEEIRSMFLEAYLRPERCREELMSLRQAEGERAGSFHLRMRWILRKWPQHGVPEEMLRGIFVDGLRAECREWVLLRAPATVEEALRAAEAWEEARARGREVRRRMREMWARAKEEGLLGTEKGGRPQQCQCSKHQCWRRTTSALTDRPPSSPPPPPTPQ